MERQEEEAERRIKEMERRWSGEKERRHGDTQTDRGGLGKGGEGERRRCPWYVARRRGSSAARGTTRGRPTTTNCARTRRQDRDLDQDSLDKTQRHEGSIRIHPVPGAWGGQGWLVRGAKVAGGRT